MEMDYLPLIFPALISVNTLGVAVNAGVMAERFSRAGNKRWQILAVALSIGSGAVSLFMAYGVGAAVGANA